MVTLLWIKRILGHRPARLGGAMLGIALTVALLASLGGFVASSSRSMTERAIAGVPVDWQVQVAPGASTQTVANALKSAAPNLHYQEVGYADSTGLSASSGGTVQTTGTAKVVGLDANYSVAFPSELRLLAGKLDGVLLAQQTASNLHVAPGAEITVQRFGLPPVLLTVDGIVDLPYADSFFQVVGAPAGTAPAAPPDNVVLVPLDRWHQLFDPQAAARPDTVRTQLHVRLAGGLSSDPAKAFTAVKSLAHNVEIAASGTATVGNNLAARLDGVRADALYARVLFLFLGLPGVVLAVLLTFSIAASAAEHRDREHALLRMRGATRSQVLRLEGVESLMVALGGVALGLLFAALATRLLISGSALTAGPALTWTVGAAVAGLILALTAFLWPVWRRVARPSGGAAPVGRVQAPLWQRLYLDVALLVAAAAAFYQIASTGYQVVLAPEGVAQTSVSYQAFVAPVCFWFGINLLAVRLFSGGMARGSRLLSWALAPLARGLSKLVARSAGRQRLRLSGGVLFVALAFAFATSTAIFNSTYTGQARVDAQLTNGADVAVIGSALSPASDQLTAIRSAPGVAAAEPMQHRYAYVGNDLQDLYGIDPASIDRATPMSNAYFANGNAASTLASLAATPDGVLVSEETVQAFQLKVGDRINLRLQSASDHQYHVVPFKFLGVVREFPTAPKDSFLVANSSYVGQQTGTGGGEVVLVRTNSDPSGVADALRTTLGPLSPVRVTDIGTAQRTIGSSLAAVSLRGLTRLELTFAVLLAAGGSGLVLALGLAERRRTFAILSALGAKTSQLGAFLWSEVILVLLYGGVAGIAIGFGVALMLVKLLTGVFDPPPEAISVPWAYLFVLVLAASVASVLTVLGALAATRRFSVETMREVL